MSIQIAVRLPDDVVHEIDDLVTAGEARSRASFVQSALERELRRRLYEREVQILMAKNAAGEKDDLDELAEWASRQPIDLP